MFPKVKVSQWSGEGDKNNPRLIGCVRGLFIEYLSKLHTLNADVSKAVCCIERYGSTVNSKRCLAKEQISLKKILLAGHFHFQ